MKHLIISVIGKDTPGLVNTLSASVYRHQGSWQASRFTQLAGQFAGIMQISLPDENKRALIADLKTNQHLQIHIVDGDESLPNKAQFSVAVSGNDRPGIIQQVSQLLSQNGINICQLKSKTESAPNWGYPLFYAQFQINLPTEIDIDDLKDQLESIADDLTIDLE
ncbi:glycine cleavage system protein R [Thaumasiovibrio sp. DFM-14]|uniref:glycine cleavage system protein R n=1 Tax=Thaumasiovibrio sp. DFM-14 TaxID=3384792 RepID=UPI00399F003B